MQIHLDAVGVDGRREPLLAAFSVVLETGSAVLVAAEPGHGHTALALVATGRLRASTGSVGLGERGVLVHDDVTALRTVSAVVDVPGITEPDDALTVADVVAEGLTLAGHRAWPGDVTRWVSEHVPALARRTRIDQLAGPDRTELLVALAAADQAVRFLVVVLPDRHGGPPGEVWALAQRYAAAGYGVLVGVTRSTARILGADLADARDVDPLHAAPVVALVSTPAEDLP